MPTFFSKQAWGRWWRDRRYDFNAWQVSQLNEDGQPKSSFLNCFGTRVNSAYGNLNQIGVERFEEEKKRLENLKDDSIKEYDRCVLAEKQHLRNYKRKFVVISKTWNESNKRRKALELAQTPDFLNFYQDLIRLKSKTTSKQKETNRISREIDKMERYIGQYQVFGRQLANGDTKLNVNEHMKKLMPMLRSANLKLDTIEDTQYIDEAEGIVKEITDKEDTRDTADGIMNASSNKLDENQIASVIAMLMGTSDHDPPVRASNNNNNNLNHASVIVDDLSEFDNNAYHDDDDESTLFLGAQLQKKKNKSGMVIMNDEDGF